MHGSTALKHFVWWLNGNWVTQSIECLHPGHDPCLLPPCRTASGGLRVPGRGCFAVTHRWQWSDAAPCPPCRAGWEGQTSLGAGCRVGGCLQVHVHAVRSPCRSSENLSPSFQTWLCLGGSFEFYLFMCVFSEPCVIAKVFMAS